MSIEKYMESFRSYYFNTALDETEKRNILNDKIKLLNLDAEECKMFEKELTSKYDTMNQLFEKYLDAEGNYILKYIQAVSDFAKDLDIDKDELSGLMEIYKSKIIKNQKLNHILNYASKEFNLKEFKNFVSSNTYFLQVSKLSELKSVMIDAYRDFFDRIAVIDYDGEIKGVIVEVFRDVFKPFTVWLNDNIPFEENGNLIKNFSNEKIYEFMGLSCAKNFEDDLLEYLPQLEDKISLAMMEIENQSSSGNEIFVGNVGTMLIFNAATSITRSRRTSNLKNHVNELANSEYKKILYKLQKTLLNNLGEYCNAQLITMSNILIDELKLDSQHYKYYLREMEELQESINIQKVSHIYLNPFNQNLLELVMKETDNFKDGLELLRNISLYSRSDTNLNDFIKNYIFYNIGQNKYCSSNFHEISEMITKQMTIDEAHLSDYKYLLERSKFGEFSLESLDSIMNNFIEIVRSKIPKYRLELSEKDFLVQYIDDNYNFEICSKGIIDSYRALEICRFSSNAQIEDLIILPSKVSIQGKAITTRYFSKLNQPIGLVNFLNEVVPQPELLEQIIFIIKNVLKMNKTVELTAFYDYQNCNELNIKEIERIINKTCTMKRGLILDGRKEHLIMEEVINKYQKSDYNENFEVLKNNLINKQFDETRVNEILNQIRFSQYKKEVKEYKESNKKKYIKDIRILREKIGVQNNLNLFQFEAKEFGYPITELDQLNYSFGLVNYYNLLLNKRKNSKYQYFPDIVENNLKMLSNALNVKLRNNEYPIYIEKNTFFGGWGKGIIVTNIGLYDKSKFYDLNEMQNVQNSESGIQFLFNNKMINIETFTKNNQELAHFLINLQTLFFSFDYNNINYNDIPRISAQIILCDLEKKELRNRLIRSNQYCDISKFVDVFNKNIKISENFVYYDTTFRKKRSQGILVTEKDLIISIGNIKKVVSISSNFDIQSDMAKDIVLISTDSSTISFGDIKSYLVVRFIRAACYNKYIIFSWSDSMMIGQSCDEKENFTTNKTKISASVGPLREKVLDEMKILDNFTEKDVNYNENEVEESNAELISKNDQSSETELNKNVINEDIKLNQQVEIYESAGKNRIDDRSLKAENISEFQPEVRLEQAIKKEQEVSSKPKLMKRYGFVEYFKFYIFVLAKAFLIFSIIAILYNKFSNQDELIAVLIIVLVINVFIDEMKLKKMRKVNREFKKAKNL